MDAELDLYATHLRELLDGLCDSLDGLTETQLNWRPPAPETNSIYIIATHILGNAHAWVLGIACGRPVERDRAAEFRASGADAGPLIQRTRGLAKEIDDAVRSLAPETLDEVRPSPQELWGAGRAEPVARRQALLHVIEHAATHLGHIHVTRDLARAAAG